MVECSVYLSSETAVVLPVMLPRAGLVELTMAEELLARMADLRHCSGVDNNNICVQFLCICFACSTVCLAFVEICLLVLLRNILAIIAKINLLLFVSLT